MKIGAYIETDIDITAFLQDNFILSCNCTGSGFIDKENKHVNM